MWYGFVLGLGLLILALSVFLLVNRVQLLKQGTITLATVTELLEEKDSDGNIQYRPVFRFTTHSNEVITFKHPTTSRPPAFSVGEEVNIVYNEIDPREPIVLTYFYSFGWAVMLAAVAMPMIVIGGGYFWAREFFERLVGG
jgi:hypothetical protein